MKFHKNKAPTESKNNALLIRIAAYHYVHVLNLRTNVTKLISGPQCYMCLQDEEVTLGPEEMISVITLKYCVIENPVMRDDVGSVVFDNYGQAKVKLGDTEIRFAQDPFPLYPGEILLQQIQDIPFVSANHALHLMALTNFVDDGGNERVNGEEWLFKGPGTYLPRKEVKITQEISANIIEDHKALVLEAKRDCVDRSGNRRLCGERWLVKTLGAFIPGVYEEVVEERTAYFLTHSTALHLKALHNFTDDYKKQRRPGDEWLVTKKDAGSHILGVYEELVRIVPVTILDTQKHCVIVNPVGDDGTPQLGKKTVVEGHKCFFLKPGERFETDIRNTVTLQMHEYLVLQALGRFEEEVVHNGGAEGTEQKRKVVRKPGDRWMLHGPIKYVPPVEVKILYRRKLIPLDRGEGIYVQNTLTGHIRAVIGEAYMLNEFEQLWRKKLPREVIEILERTENSFADDGAYDDAPKHLNLTRVVTYRVPHNAAVQIYDFEEKKSRVEFGPNLVMLGPHEQFTLLDLSGGEPKKPHMIKSLCLLLGPDFCTDVIVVETADHARLSLQLSYNWHFKVPNPCSPQDATKLFSVPDFVGDMCKAITSRIHGMVASVQFYDFHKNLSHIIQSAVFGLDEQGKVRDQFIFPHNNLCITSIDVQSVEPVDQRTRDSLRKSVKLAIESATNAQEAAARHEAERIEQQVQARLERQKIEDATSVERAGKTLTKIKIQSAALKRYGQATIEAEIRAEVALIEAQAAMKQSKLRSEATTIKTDAEHECLKETRAAELEYISAKDHLALKLKTDEAITEIQHFSAMVSAIGPDTLRAIATAGPEHNIRMLSALGLHSTLITDGATPINLLNTAHGLIGTSMDMNGKNEATPLKMVQATN